MSRAMLSIGWASRDITPDRPALLQGQKHRRIGRSALDPLTVTAWVFDGRPGRRLEHDAADTDVAVIVSCDLAFPSDALYAEVRSAVADRLPDVPPDAVVLCATHTHTSMVFEDGLYPMPEDEAVMTPAECRHLIAGRIVAAVEAAWKDRRPRRIRRAFCHAVVGHNRYAVYADGRATMYGKTNRDDFSHIGGYEDHSFDLLAVYEEPGPADPCGAAPPADEPAPSALCLVVPCPAQVDESLWEFSADYWHEVRHMLRDAYGPELSVLGLCGAAGDQSPHLLLYREIEEEMRRRRGVSERQGIAERIAAGVARGLAGSSEDMEPTLAHRRISTRLTPRAITQDDRDLAERLYQEAVAAGDTDSWFPRRAKRVVDTFDGLRSAEPVPTELHVIRIGEMVVTTSPFELFLDYALQVKARSAAKQTAVVQLAGRGFYLPTERAVRGGSYGAFPVVSAVGPRGGAELVERILQEIGELV
jgi:hypothetical protein